MNILRQSPRFFHEHDTGQLTLIVNQFCVEAETGLRQLLVDPILQLVGIGSVGFALYGQLSQSARTPGDHRVAYLFGLVALMALLSLWLVARMGLQQQQALTLSTLINGAVSAPEEIQAMRAERTQAQRQRLAKSRLELGTSPRLASVRWSAWLGWRAHGISFAP